MPLESNLSSGFWQSAEPSSGCPSELNFMWLNLSTVVQHPVPPNYLQIKIPLPVCALELPLVTWKMDDNTFFCCKRFWNVIMGRYDKWNHVTLGSTKLLSVHWSFHVMVSVIVSEGRLHFWALTFQQKTLYWRFWSGKLINKIKKKKKKGKRKKKTSPDWKGKCRWHDLACSEP